MLLQSLLQQDQELIPLLLLLLHQLFSLLLLRSRTSRLYPRLRTLYVRLYCLLLLLQLHLLLLLLLLLLLHGGCQQPALHCCCGPHLAAGAPLLLLLQLLSFVGAACGAVHTH